MLFSYVVQLRCTQAVHVYARHSYEIPSQAGLWYTIFLHTGMMFTGMLYTKMLCRYCTQICCTQMFCIQLRCRSYAELGQCSDSNQALPGQQNKIKNLSASPDCGRLNGEEKGDYIARFDEAGITLRLSLN